MSNNSALYVYEYNCIITSIDIYIWLTKIMQYLDYYGKFLFKKYIA